MGNSASETYAYGRTERPLYGGSQEPFGSVYSAYGFRPGVYTAGGDFSPWEKYGAVCPDGVLLKMPPCPSFSGVIIPEGISAIGACAFMESAVSSVIFPESLVSAGVYAFAKSRLTAAVLPSRLRQIKFGAFAASDIRYVFLPPSVSEIGDRAFSRCGNLKTVYFPRRGTVKCGSCLFAGCGALESVSVPRVSGGGGMFGEGCAPASVFFPCTMADVPVLLDDDAPAGLGIFCSDICRYAV